MQPTTATRLLVGIMTLLLASATPAQPAEPGDDSPEARREQARVDRLWKIHWREVAPFYLEHDGEYLCVPGYDRRTPSSTGTTVRDYQAQSAWDQDYTDERGRERSRKLVKPDEEAHAGVALLPEVAVGNYGYIHSGRIDRIVDDKTLVLEDVWLVDAEADRQAKEQLKADVLRGLAEDIEDAVRDRGREARRNRGDGIVRRRTAENRAIDWAFEDRDAAARRQRDRAFARTAWTIVGYQTGRLTEDARWPTGRAAEDGLQLVIVAVDGNRATAVPAASIGSGLTEYKFFDMLTERGISQADFVAMVSEAKRESRDGYVPLVLAQLEGEAMPTAIGGDPPSANDAVELAE